MTCSLGWIGARLLPKQGRRRNGSRHGRGKFPVASPRRFRSFLTRGRSPPGHRISVFGHAALWRTIDARLAENGLGRAHYRALYFIARQPGLTISDLLALLGITKQSLGRVIKEMEARALLATRPGNRDRRQKELRLTPKDASSKARSSRSSATR